MQHASLKYQKATALLSALFIMTLVAIAATAVSLRVQLDIYRTQLIINSDKLYLATQSVVFWAMDGLSNKRTTLDRLGPTGEVANFPAGLSNIYPDIKVQGTVYDLQAKFNLNNLEKKQTLPLFQNILNHVLTNKSRQENEAIALAIQDWISNYSLDKGKDKYQSWYLKQRPPYYASHQPMTGISELRLIQGINAKEYHALFSFVTVLPEHTPINIKTANAKVLLSLKKDMTEAQMEEILVARKEEKPDNALNAIINKLQLPNDTVTLSSKYFLVVATVTGHEMKLINYTVLKRVSNQKGDMMVSLISESLNAL